MSHTPGPWNVQRGAFAAPDLGRAIVINHKTEEDGWWQIRAEAKPGDLHDDLRLIAAAPELLEALRMLTAWALDTHGGNAAWWPVNHARAAIAKATGEQP